MDGKIYFDPDSPLLVAEGTLSLGKSLLVSHFLLS